MSLMPSVIHHLSWAILIAACAASARADDFPARPVRVIVLTAPGSALDVLMRIVSEQLSQIWGKDVIALVAPHGTPPAIVQNINEDLRRALASPELVKKVQDFGNYTRSMTPQELTDYINDQRQV